MKTTFSDIWPYPTLSNYKGLRGHTPISNQETFIGLELEIENIHLPNQPIPSVWKITEDGSLKNRGKEFVSVPIRCKYVEVELHRLFSFLNQDISYSSRCSVHVHMNARDLTIEELQTFVLVYMCFEKLLYKFSGNRWNNIFCIPLYDYNGQASAVIKTNKIESLRGYSWYKYSGLNLSPLWGGTGDHSTKTRIGTIEFRQMKGTNDVPKIIQWVNFITDIKTFCKRTSLSSFIETLIKLNTDSSYYRLAESVFGPNYVLLEPTKEELETCITRAKTCLQPIYVKEEI